MDEAQPSDRPSGESEQGGEPTQAVARRPDRTPLSRRDPIAIAQKLFESGYFKDTKSLSQTVAKILAGEELGLGPVTSMTGVHIIEGKPSLSANLLGVQVKRSGRYNYRLREASTEKVELEFFEDGESVGLVSFTMEDAARAKAKENGTWKALPETHRWKSWPEDMLFARCLSRGVRRFCPDVTAGTPAYTPEELGAEVDADGEPIYVESEAEVVEPDEVLLDPDTVDQLAKGIDAAGLTLDDLNVTLGALGVNGLDPARDRDEQLATLTQEQAEALNADLQARVDAQDGEEAGNADD